MAFVLSVQAPHRTVGTASLARILVDAMSRFDANLKTVTNNRSALTRRLSDLTKKAPAPMKPTGPTIRIGG